MKKLIRLELQKHENDSLILPQTNFSIEKIDIIEIINENENKIVLKNGIKLSKEHLGEIINLGNDYYKYLLYNNETFLYLEQNFISFYQDLIYLLKENEKDIHDIVWVGTRENLYELETFLEMCKLITKEQIDKTIVIQGNGWDISFRSDGWTKAYLEFHKAFERPKEHIENLQLEHLKQNSDVWETSLYKM